MARRRTLYRCYLFSFGGPQTEGVVSQWTKNLAPIREKTVFSGEIVELYVTIQASIHPVTEDARVRFDILEKDPCVDDRIVSFLGTGVDQTEERFTPQNKRTVLHRLTDGQSIQSYIEQFKQNQSDYQDHIMVVEEPHEGRLYHILAWWTAQGLENRHSELYFIINVNDNFEDQSEEIIHVSPAINIPMTLSWEDGNRTFTLTTRFRDLDFEGEIVISRTYCPDYGDYSRLNRFSLDSRQDQDEFAVSRRREDTIEIRQTLQVLDIDRNEPEGYITSYPLNNQTERMRLNRINEPRYAFKVQLTKGDEGFGAEQENMVVRAFEDSGHPVEDDIDVRSYRARMVGIPDEIVEELRNQILAANNESERSTGYSWWTVPSYIVPSVGRARELLASERIIKSPQQIEQKINDFVALATSNQDIRSFINHHFNFEKINSDLSAIRGIGMVGEYLYLFSSNIMDCEITLRIVGLSGDQRVEESIILEGRTEVQTRHQYLNIESIEVEQGTLKGILKVGIIDNEAFSVNVNERKIRYDNLREFNGFLRHAGCQLSAESTANSDISKTIIILGYRDEHLRDQVAEEIPIGTTGNITFYKIHHIYFRDNFNGIISIRATRDSTHKILWRNIFDEDIPETIVTSFQPIRRPIFIFVELRAQYLQRLANIFRKYLGIDKDIWVFLYDRSDLGPAEVAAKAKPANDYYHLIEVYTNHVNFFSFSDFIRHFVHECKHVHQNDRIEKLPQREQDVEFDAWRRGHETWDMRLVKAWKLNKGSGYISSSESLENYEGQITEVDADEFAQRVITEEWLEQLSIR